MNKVTFKYGTVASGKSLDLIKTAKNFDLQGKKSIIFTTQEDTRGRMATISSQLGMEKEAYLIEKEEVMIFIKEQLPDIVLCDEAQMYPVEKVLTLCRTSDYYDIPIIFYGLKSDFRGKIFEASKVLIAFADKLEEIKTTCFYCGRKAIFNLKIDEDENPIFSGKQIEVGGVEKYRPVCRKHFTQKLIKEMENDLL